MKNEYSRCIRRLLDSTGMDYQDIAFEIDASIASIYKWIAGTSVPDFVHTMRLLKLAKVIDEDVSSGSF